MFNRYNVQKIFNETEFDYYYSTLQAREQIDSANKNSNCITLLIDGWSNIKKQNIINIVACIPEPHFVRSINTKDESHTALHMFNEIEKDITRFGKLVNLLYIFLLSIQFFHSGPGNIVAIVSDNAYNMQSMKKMVKVKYEHIEILGCVAHGLNLLLNDINKLEVFDGSFDIAKSIVKEINGSNMKLAKFTLLRKNECKSLKYYTPTRYANLLCIVPN